MLAPLKKSYDKLREHIKKQRHQLINKSLCSQSYMVFPAFMHECESRTITEAEGQRIDAFGLWCWRRLLNSKEIKPVNPEGNHPWIFLGMTHVETPTLWPPDEKSRLIEKYPDAGQD